MLAKEGQVRVLRELARHDRFVPINSLAEALPMSPQGLNSTLSALIGYGIVRVDKSGQETRYKLADHPLTPPLVALFDVEEQAFENDMKVLVSSAEAEAGILSAWLYGRAAKETDSFTNNLEIAIVTQGDVDPVAVGEAFRQSVMADASRLRERISLMIMIVEETATIVDQPWWSLITETTKSLKGPLPSREVGVLQDGSVVGPF
ncbi:ArsR/SmtB family transcription factor [Antarcticirhabdus aurantiaca]|uniref:Winged helix-turn-helix domain-containing protein n=1 Tax=Antarcticirhabdus aurantiaca TaxID=2606717 RepID=A0ACD4NIN0_9HYPH|nr:winged helix-turn-helix domain-containing protein [Antarcticirhabdus aurantiaca]WAJ26655.1 winged helix-turn-helix domain-containing protein [Jeongeuplla avenae]